MKKFYAAVLTLYICLCLTGCAKEETHECAYYNQFAAKEVDISGLGERPIVSVVGYCGQQMICSVIDVSYEPEDRYIVYYSYDMESGGFDPIRFENKEAAQDTQNEQPYIVRWEDDKLLKYVEEKQSVFAMVGEVPKSEISTGGTVLDTAYDRDNIYVTSIEDQGYRLTIIDSDMEIVFQETGGIFQLYPSVEAKCRISALHEGGGKYQGVYTFDNEKSALVKDKDIKWSKEESEQRVSYRFIAGNAFYDFYYYDPQLESSSITLMGVKDGVESKILCFTDFMLYPDNVGDIYPDRDGGFLISMQSYEANGLVCRLLHLKKSDMPETVSQEEKIEICVGGIDIPHEIEEAVFDFNASSDTYRISLKEYLTDDDTMDAARNALLLDMMKQDEIDAILLNGLVKSELIEKQVLTDLNTYLETSKVLSKDALEPCVRNAIEEEDGAVYSLYPEFTIEAYIAKGKQSLTDPESYIAMLEQGRAVFADSSPEYILSTMLRYAPQLFDEIEEQGYKSDSLRSLLRLVKQQIVYNQEHPDISQESGPLLLSSDQAVFMKESIDFPYAYLFYMYLFGGEYTCTNYMTNRPVLQPACAQICVLETSEQKEGLYAFFDYIFEEQNYKKYFGDVTFPVLKSLMEDKYKEMTATEMYVDRFGKEIKPAAFSYGYDEIDIEIGPLTEEQLEQLQTFLADTVYVEPVKQEYQDIISEEAKSYFSDEKELDEVCLIIQNRMKQAYSE